MGLLALQLDHYPLARHCFEQVKLSVVCAFKLSFNKTIWKMPRDREACGKAIPKLQALRRLLWNVLNLFVRCLSVYAWCEWTFVICLSFSRVWNAVRNTGLAWIRSSLFCTRWAVMMVNSKISRFLCTAVVVTEQCLPLPLLLSACLVYVARALQRDSGYVKGLAFMNKILSEQNCLNVDKDSLFKDWWGLCCFLRWWKRLSLASSLVDPPETMLEVYWNCFAVMAKFSPLCWRRKSPVRYVRDLSDLYSFVFLSWCLRDNNHSGYSL